jgi:hypothetical protein
MTDDLTILASTYLDGQATAVERAQVEGDVELLAEVERLRRVRSVLGSPDDSSTAPLSTRERHLAAAFDAWDRLPASELGSDATPAGADQAGADQAGADQAGAAGGASITAPIPMREQRSKRRPVGTRFLTAAAAVVVLAGAGLVVRGALEASDTNESADTASIDLDSTSDEGQSPDVLAAEEFATEGEGEAADDIADEAAPPAAVEPEAVVSGGPEQAPGEGELEVLSSTVELADFANLLTISRTNQTNAASASAEMAVEESAADSDAGQATTPTTPPTLPAPVDLCGLIDDFVGFAIWDASGSFDDPVAVGIDNSTNEAVAYQPDTCAEVERTPLP